MIPTEERQLCTRATQNALAHFASRDLEKLLADLWELNDVYVYSDYPFYREWRETKPFIVRFLFESLPFSQFLQFPNGRNFYKSEVIRELDELAPNISVPQIQSLCERFDFPRQSGSPLLFQKLVEAPDQKITEWLRDHIERILENRRVDLKKGAVFDLYDVDGLADKVAIFARRNDTKALELCRTYGLNLPWETKLRGMNVRTRIFAHGSTAQLLDGIAFQNTIQTHQIIEKWVDFHRTPDILRLYLLSKLRAFAPRQAIEKAFDDIDLANDTSIRESYLQWLATNHDVIAPLQREMTPQWELDKWSPLSRAMWFSIAHEKFPEWNIALSGREKLIVATIAAFEKLRWNYERLGLWFMGCLFVSLLYLVILSRWLGNPSENERWLNALPAISFIDLILLMLMALSGLFTAKWQGSNQESARHKWDGSIALFGWHLAFLVGTILVRVF